MQGNTAEIRNQPISFSSFSKETTEVNGIITATSGDGQGAS